MPLVDIPLSGKNKNINLNIVTREITLRYVTKKSRLTRATNIPSHYFGLGR